MMTDTRDPARRHHHHGLYLRCGVALVVWFGGWSVSASVPEPMPGTARCRSMSKASTLDYLTGVACPPDGFAGVLGYDPILVRTPYGWRYTKPTELDGRCSGPLHALGANLDFEPVCRTHDYGYDLVRFGAGNRHDADEVLYRDMLTVCSLRDSVSGGGCRAVARWSRTVLELGDATGFDPDPLLPA